MLLASSQVSSGIQDRTPPETRNGSKGPRTRHIRRQAHGPTLLADRRLSLSRVRTPGTVRHPAALIDFVALARWPDSCSDVERPRSLQDGVHGLHLFTASGVRLGLDVIYLDQSHLARGCARANRCSQKLSQCTISLSTQQGQSSLPCGEGQLVHHQLDYAAQGSCAVADARFSAQDCQSPSLVAGRTTCGMLESRAHLPCVQGVNQGVSLGDGEQHRGVVHSLPDVVVRRVPQEPIELLLHRSGAVLRDPGRSEARAGKYLLATSDPDLSAENVALGYKNLLEAERSFRTMKSTLYLRPVYHRLDDRIRAHVLLCWLALLLIRVAERRTSTTWRTIRNELGRIHQVTLAGPAGRLQQTTRLSDAQAKLFKDCGVPLPPKMTGLQTPE